MRESPSKISLVGLLQAAAVITVVFSLLTGLDIPHYAIELFSHFRLQYFVASLLLLGVFLYLGNRLYIGALIIIAAFNASLVFPWYYADKDPARDTTIKLIHANVHSSSTEYQRLVDFIALEQPDIFFLQEVNAAWVAGTHALLADYPYSYIEPREGNFGIAAFSRLPFDSIGHVDSPPLNHPTIFATLKTDKTPVTFISSHPTIPVNKELYAARNAQLTSITALVGKTPGKLVLLGDFNASIWDVQFRRLESTTGLKNVRRGFGILPSWPTFMPFAMIPIDHALVSQDISVMDARTGKNIGSDHLPLIVTLSL
jgi:endonuclease/exonuclease/phosphatase (EEP) superfamily protein YafD